MVVLLERNVYGHLFDRTIVGKAVRESSFIIRMGKSTKLGMLIHQQRERTVLICVCGRYQTGWKETAC